MTYGLAFAPFLPWPLLGAVALVALVLAALLVVSRTRGAVIRALALVVGLLALANPSLTREEREPLSSVVAVVVDKSASQNFGDRTAQAEAARAALDERLKRIPGLEIRTIEADARDGETDGTRLFSALSAGLADVPPERVAGAVMITDGRVHDVPEQAAALGFSAPVHGLITGRAGERDRRVALERAPRFGIVGQRQTLTFRVTDEGAPAGARVGVTVRRDGEVIANPVVTTGRSTQVEVEIAHAGPNIVEVEVPPLEGELTPINNRAAVSIDGVRDKLRVLLVSGEPNVGERTWRNLLKSDANVDLVHFTILRPPEKQDGTPINELSLIAFPTRELFQTKIRDFDLIIFDRYSQQGVLPQVYFDNIVRYVRAGGALLVAAGTDFVDTGSLYNTPLEEILPAAPTGQTTEAPYVARLTDPGKRHPVTRGLPGAESDPPHWSRFFRVVDADARSGVTVLGAPGDKPVLQLDRVGQGRVALLLSDHFWLWARGYDGGGPYIDLLRRLSHWLMKEPDLEEERLKLSTSGRDLVVERQTMGDTVPTAQVTTPSGAVRTLTLKEAEPGLWRATTPADELGLWRAVNGQLTALTNIGPLNPKEFAEVTSTKDWLTPIAAATGGGLWRLADLNGTVPRVVAVSSGERLAGEDWLGLRTRDVSVVRGIGLFPLFAGLSGLLLLLGVITAAWVREGR
ncbi:membrane protein [Azorhizobium doebereinerae]|uniref:membrane protein n=1 Tax=Azorhizobium doebereinerae TaxID=281091 RepID=UPI0003F7820D|nr:membrane protein [Azorhizobium doebereinerae]